MGQPYLIKIHVIIKSNCAALFGVTSAEEQFIELGKLPMAKVPLAGAGEVDPLEVGADVAAAGLLQ